MGNFEADFKAAAAGDGPPDWMENNYISSNVNTNELA